MSIIVRHYNGSSHLLQAALLSALSQRGLDVEVLLVDDGSTPPLGLEWATDPRVGILWLPHNHGVALARDFGVRAARGRYVRLLDDDDEFLTESSLAEQVRFLKDSKASVCIGTRQYFEDPQKISGDKEVLQKNWDGNPFSLRDAILNSYYLPCAGASILWERLEVPHESPADFLACEDPVWLKENAACLRDQDIVYFEKPTYRYRQIPYGSPQKTRFPVFEEAIGLCEEFWQKSALVLRYRRALLRQTGTRKVAWVFPDEAGIAQYWHEVEVLSRLPRKSFERRLYMIGGERRDLCIERYLKRKGVEICYFGARTPGRLELELKKWQPDSLRFFSDRNRNDPSFHVPRAGVDLERFRAYECMREHVRRIASIPAESPVVLCVNDGKDSMLPTLLQEVWDEVLRRSSVSPVLAVLKPHLGLVDVQPSHGKSLQMEGAHPLIWPKIFSAADLFLAINLGSPLSAPVLSALAASLPVISPQSSEEKEGLFLGNGSCCVSYPDAKLLAGKILKVLDYDQGYRAKIGQFNRFVAAARYHVLHLARELALDLLEMEAAEASRNEEDERIPQGIVL